MARVLDNNCMVGRLGCRTAVVTDNLVVNSVFQQCLKHAVLVSE